MLSGIRHKLALCTVFLSTGIMPLQSHALEPSTPLQRLGHQSWTMENGLPQNTVSVLLQSHSGFLWAGTELGLTRFDGVGFRIFDHATAPPFPDAEVHCLLDIGPDLWVGTSDGLIRLRDGRPTRFTTRDGLPGNSIRGLAQTSDGILWALSELTGLAEGRPRQVLARWTGKQFSALNPDHLQPGISITSIAADTHGGLWLGTPNGAAVLRQGLWQADTQHTSPNQPAFVTAATDGYILLSSAAGTFQEHSGNWTTILSKSRLPRDAVIFLAKLKDGTVAASSKSTVVLSHPGSPNSGLVDRGTRSYSVGAELPGSRIEALFADREGSLWVGTNRGLARITTDRGNDTVQLFPQTDTLATASVVNLLEDREGDLWIGTESSGLHILRDTRFRITGSSDGLSSDSTTAVVADAQNGLWVGTKDGGLNHLSSRRDNALQIRHWTATEGLLSNIILSLASSRSGDIWVGTPDGLNRIRGQQVTSYTSADGLPDDFIRSLLVAPDNTLWIGTRRGLTHFEHGIFSTMTTADGLGSDLVGAMTRTPDGDLWIATLNGLSRLHAGRLTNYTTANGLSSNVITALEATSDGKLWIGTQNHGINLWEGSHFTAIQTDAKYPAGLPTAIHAIVQDDQGQLWLATDSGLTRASSASLLACARSHRCDFDAASLTNFTTADGLRSRETSSNSHPTAVRALDGQIWFATPRGVVTVDPAHFPTEIAPLAAIERFAVDDRDQDTLTAMRITAGAQRFQFDYAGLSFAAPQKLRYQYMLEGFDHGWTDAGPRRTAYYTNIPPGTYRFRARAALSASDTAAIAEDADTSAAIGFELLPHYYQTIWFWIIMVLVAIALVLLIVRRRVLRVKREFQAVMGERNRIAREIHDTLAQGYVGISLQLEILGELLRHNRTDIAVRHLAGTQELVREGLDDARQSIWALRSQDAAETTLPIRLRRLVEKARTRKLATDVVVYGAYRALAPNAEQEILRIAQEAIQNVKRHAEASRLTVRLDYEEQSLALTVSDNGRGFATAQGKPAIKPTRGHYGLTGMQERAALIHGEIEFASNPGDGTTVRLKVPAPEMHSRPGISSATEASQSDTDREETHQEFK